MRSTIPFVRDSRYDDLLTAEADLEPAGAEQQRRKACEIFELIKQHKQTPAQLYEYNRWVAQTFGVRLNVTGQTSSSLDSQSQRPEPANAASLA